MTEINNPSDIEKLLTDLPEGDPMPTSLPFPTIKHHFCMPFSSCGTSKTMRYLRAKRNDRSSP